MLYRGWVPTVSGHLSFSAVGETDFPTRCRTLRCNGRIISIQKRDLLDVVVPLVDTTPVGQFFREYLANRLIGITGDFSFVCIADTPKSRDRLSGSIFLISNFHNKSSIKDILKLVKSCEVEADFTPEVQERISDIVAKNQKYSSKFTLWRDGQIDVETAAKLDESDEKLTIDQIIADQFFFFIKDLAHRHQHHDPDHDAITRLSRCTSPDDTEWVVTTQNALYRSVIRYKRFRNEKALFRASGILAYARSFERSHAEKNSGIRKFNTEEIDMSLSVSREEIQHFDQKSIAHAESLRNFFFAFFAFIISAVSIAQFNDTLKISPHWIYFWITDSVANHPIETIGVIWIVSTINAFWSHRKDPANFSLIRALLSWFQGFRMRWFMVANLMIVAVLTTICYFLLIRHLF